jgi:hypothetical protein
MSNMRNRSQRSGSNGGSHGGSSHSGSSYGGGSHSGSRPKTVSRSNTNRRSNGSGSSANVAGAKSNYDKYIERANEAKSYGDRVSAEKLLQYADHYMRIIIESEEKRESFSDKDEFNINAYYNITDVQEDADKEKELIDDESSDNNNIPKEFCL